MSRPRLGFVVHLALAAALLPVLPASAATDPIRCDNYEYSMRGERMFWYGNCRDHAQKVSVQFRPVAKQMSSPASSALWIACFTRAVTAPAGESSVPSRSIAIIR